MLVYFIDRYTYRKTPNALIVITRNNYWANPPISIWVTPSLDKRRYTYWQIFRTQNGNVAIVFYRASAAFFARRKLGWPLNNQAESRVKNAVICGDYVCTVQIWIRIRCKSRYSYVAILRILHLGWYYLVLLVSDGNNGSF